MYTQTTGTDNGLNTITWTAEAVALTVHAESGLILNVDVDEDRRGEGLARAIYEHAASVMDIYHVPAWGRTFEGNLFAEAMGGETMVDEAAAAIVGMDLDVLDAA